MLRFVVFVLTQYIVAYFYTKFVYSGKRDCPCCNDRKVYPGVNSFKVRRPDLMKEWDEIANYFSADPDTIGERSKEIAWWNCDKGHTYKMSIIRRVVFDYRGLTACPYCKGINKKKSHSFRR